MWLSVVRTVKVVWKKYSLLIPMMASAWWGSNGMRVGGLGESATDIDSIARGIEATADAAIRTMMKENRKVRLDISRPWTFQRWWHGQLPGTGHCRLTASR